jgi:ABC-2 type transport system permease protein
MSSTQGFHAIMNLFLMPLWFLSGALFPPEGAMGGLKWVMWLNPLTYGLSGLRHALDPNQPSPGLFTCFAVSLGFAALLFGAASLIARGRASGDFE